MRRIALAMLIAVSTACTGAAAPDREPGTIETEPPVAATPPPTAAPTSPSSTEHPEREQGDSFMIRGTLPDGTPYALSSNLPLQPSVDGINAGIMIDLDDGTSRAVGIVSFHESRVESGELDGLVYRAPAGTGTVQIAVYPDVAAKSADLVGLLDASIDSGDADSGPSLVLHTPLRWADDAELPLQMEVWYDRFVVRRGCSDLAAACSPTRAVQVISRDRVSSSPLRLPDGPVWIESPAPRPATDPSYLPPGPLLPRSGGDVIWTGAEMIIWGGVPGQDREGLRDGAAFDPASDAWRMLPASSLATTGPSRAVWAGDRMVVVAPESTVSYDPATDTWRTEADGLAPPSFHGLITWTGDSVVAWTDDGIFALGGDDGAWRRLPSPGFGRAERFRGALRTLDGRLIAVGVTEDYCGGRRVATWDGTIWQEAPAVSLAAGFLADCSWANQTAVAGHRVIIWGDRDLETMAYDIESRVWERIDTVPLAGAEGPPGPVTVGDGFIVPEWTGGASFDPSTSRWTTLAFPGRGSSAEIVWTGDELLMWGAACCFDGLSEFSRVDAWRMPYPMVQASDQS